MQKDIHGLALSGATDAAVRHYETAVAELQCYRGDPVAQVNAALAEAPDFAMALALKAWLHLLGTEPGSVPTAKKSQIAAARTAVTARERGHVAALAHLVDGRWHAAGRVLEDVTVEAPRDALGLLVGHQIDFFTGHSRMLRDRISRALPDWDAAMPGYHSILGMHAFGLEETGDYARAEAVGRRGVELEPRDGWSQHAVAHVMEMQSRQADGIAWMRSNDQWAGDSFFQGHNWWHLALYHLELGDIPEVLALFDGAIGGGRSGVVMDMVDASALLWRLMLRGVEVEDRWDVLADLWAQVAPGTYAFNDTHAVMAFVGAGRQSAAEAVLAAQREAMQRSGDNAASTSEVGHSVAQALVAFGDCDYAKAAELLRQVRSVSHRFGGSHAQRDVLDLTLIEATIRAGNGRLAMALATERKSNRHESPLSQLFVRRAEALSPEM